MCSSFRTYHDRAQSPRPFLAYIVTSNVIYTLLLTYAEHELKSFRTVDTHPLAGARVITVFWVPARAYFVLNLRTDIRQNAYGGLMWLLGAAAQYRYSYEYSTVGTHHRSNYRALQIAANTVEAYVMVL